MMTRTEAEAVYTEAKRTGDTALIAQWNDWCSQERARLAARDRARKANGIGHAYLSLWGG